MAHLECQCRNYAKKYLDKPESFWKQVLCTIKSKYSSLSESSKVCSEKKKRQIGLKDQLAYC